MPVKNAGPLLKFQNCSQGQSIARADVNVHFNY